MTASSLRRSAVLAGERDVPVLGDVSGDGRNADGSSLIVLYRGQDDFKDELLPAFSKADGVENFNFTAGLDFVNFAERVLKSGGLRERRMIAYSLDSTIGARK